jgi:phosphoribosylformylglycinamidine synthase
LYSESASRLVVSVKPENAPAFEALFAGQHLAKLGMVGGESLVITAGGAPVLTAGVEELAESFKAPLNW